MRYRKRKPSKAICAGCGELLHGVPREEYRFHNAEACKDKEKYEGKFRKMVHFVPNVQKTRLKRARSL